MINFADGSDWSVDDKVWMLCCYERREEKRRREDGEALCRIDFSGCESEEIASAKDSHDIDLVF